jgi:formate hydrogenlyase transcriptional activator
MTFRPLVEETSLAARYRALIRVSEALGAFHERDALFRNLAGELRQVVNFDFLGLAIYDGQTNTIEACVLESTGEAIPPPQLVTEDSLTYWVVHHQQPVVIPLVERETRFPQAIGYMKSQSMQSACALPLTTLRRRVGLLFAASREARTYDGADLTFLGLVANQVALAIDDALNYGALQQAALEASERARNLEASDELLRALSPVLDVRAVFSRISEIADAVVSHDLLTLAFFDGEDEVVQAASHDLSWFPGTRLKLADASPTKEDAVTIVDELTRETFEIVEPEACWDRIRSAGYRSMLIVRLRAHLQPLSLQFWSKRPRAFEPQQVPVARRVADHVALAVSHEQLSEAARQAAEARMRAERLEARVASLSNELAVRTGHARMIGVSEAWQAVLKAATQVAGTETTVLLEGESGTGKEVVARFIHQASNRKAGPFVALNCAALPEQLLESELFGYERGAFTGAHQSKPGQIELAAGGVLFLDEVSAMSASAQAKFLRVLQEREFQRLGAIRTLKANVRIVAATNRDLKKAMERGDFRDDLYYRLQVFDIKLPALRDRPTDILPLSDAFLQDIGQMFGRPPAGLTRDGKEALLRYQWPGNVRELRNALERAAILCEGGLITVAHLSLNRERPTPTPTPTVSETSTVGGMEREMITKVLAECRGNKSKAAARLGLSRTQLYVRLRKYQLL